MDNKQLHNPVDLSRRKMMTIWIVFILVIASSSSMGCASLQTMGAKSYAAPVLSVTANRTELMRAAVAHVLKEGWDIVKIDEAAGVVEALSVVERSGDYAQRNRWFFMVENNSIAISKKREKQFGSDAPDVWISNDLICDGYKYYDEKHQLSKMENTLVTPKNSSLIAAVDLN